MSLTGELTKLEPRSLVEAYKTLNPSGTELAVASYPILRTLQYVALKTPGLYPPETNEAGIKKGSLLIVGAVAIIGANTNAFTMLTQALEVDQPTRSLHDELMALTAVEVMTAADRTVAEPMWNKDADEMWKYLHTFPAFYELVLEGVKDILFEEGATTTMLSTASAALTAVQLLVEAGDLHEGL